VPAESVELNVENGTTVIALPVAGAGVCVHALGATVPVGFGDGVAVATIVAVGDGEVDGDADADAVAVAEAVTVGDAVAVGEPGGPAVDVSLGVGLLEARGLETPIGSGEEVDPPPLQAVAIARRAIM
jgi:hypothetical protein